MVNKRQQMQLCKNCKIVFFPVTTTFRLYIINTFSYSLNKGSLNDAKKKIRSTRPLSNYSLTHYPNFNIVSNL